MARGNGHIEVKGLTVDDVCTAVHALEAKANEYAEECQYVLADSVASKFMKRMSGQCKLVATALSEAAGLVPSAHND